MKTALITGIAGQDGSYLAELLLKKGFCVHGIVKRSFIEDQNRLKNLKNILGNITLHTNSLDNHLLVYKLIEKIKPSECYHLAADSFVNPSIDDEISALNKSFNATYFLLSSIKEAVPACRFYFAGSSEMFGKPTTSPQNETTPFNPRSIYGISKLTSYYLVKTYREQHNIYACTGISYNHESPRRGSPFVTKKIIRGIKNIFEKKACTLTLGNIDSVRDWGYAPDYVEAMHKMLNNQHGPRDYIISTGIPHTVKDMLKTAFSLCNLDYKKYIKIDEKLFRPSEKINLVGDNSKIKKELGWFPKTNFENMIKELLHKEKIPTSIKISHQATVTKNIF